MAGTSYTIRPGDWQALRDLANAFHNALEASPTADLENFLPPKGERLRPPALLELIEIDLAFHWQRGRGPLLEDYLKRFPELGPAPLLSAKLVYAEYRQRKMHGDRPSLDTYKRRFAEQYSELESLAVADPTANPSTTPATPKPARVDGPVVDDPQGVNKYVGFTKPKSTTPTPSVEGPQAIAEGATLPFGGGYTLTARLGSGSFGEVWRARSAGGGFENAIKVIFRSEDEDVQREVHALEVIRELRHPYLLSTQSFWFVGKRLYIVMELADCSLRQLLRAGKQAGTPIAAGQLLSYLRETAEALDFLHSRGVMHRDIKPENILVLEGHVKVADFGVVRLQEGRAESATVLGTPQYMPPEVWGGKVSIHSDQYSLALTYAELRMGRRAFATSGFPQLMQAHCGGEPDLQPLPEPERRVVLRALAKDPERRFPSCCEFVRALDEAVADPALPNRRAQTRSRSRTTLPVYVLLLCGLFLAAAALIWVVVSPDPPPADAPQFPAKIPVRAGEQVTFSVTLERARRDGSLVLKCNNLPRDIDVEPNPVVIPEGVAEVKITLKVSASAEPGTVALTFDRLDGDSVTLDLLIQPLATLPAGCLKAIGTIVRTDMRGKNHYKTVEYLLPDKTTIAFCLVEQEQPDHAQTFYIMRDKVANDLYRKYVACLEGPTSTLPTIRAIGGIAMPGPVGAHRFVCSYTAAAIEEPRWTLGGIMLVKAENGKVTEKDVLAHDRLPVLRVTAFQAHWFARWLGGRLPSITEWDRAAGRGQPGRQGPFDGDWQTLKHDPKANIGVGRAYKGPLSLDEKTVDVSYFGCRHMSGNGKEWTNDLTFPDHQTVSEFADRTPPPTPIVSLRGESYARVRPVLFENLDDHGMAEDAEEAHPEIGFRVVLNPL